MSQPVSTIAKRKASQRSEVVVPTQAAETVATESVAESISAAPATAGVKDSYAKDLLVLIHQRKVYPRLAQKMGHRGRLLAQLRVAQDGRILDSQIIESSKYVTLNEAAEKLMKSLPQLKPFPDHVKDKEWVFHIPIDYKIE